MQENFNLSVIRPLDEILAARDARSLLRKEISLQGRPSISLNLNIPGYPKVNPVTERFFSYCCDDLRIYLASHRVNAEFEKAVIRGDAAGDFYLVPFSAGAHTLAEIKNICGDFEETHAWGRFIDVDVTDTAGEPVSSGKSKPCFYCGEYPANVCRRDKMHEAEELRTFMFSEMKTWCLQQREKTITRNLSAMALQSILREIALTPKPGLVDKVSNGSHHDMNFSTFMNSTASISGYFTELAKAGFDFAEKDMTKALPVIRNIGLRMEKAMFESTNNVNTQKGIIFLMGISLFSSGYLFAHEDGFGIEKFRTILKSICRNLTERELQKQKGPAETHGEHIYHQLKITGARGEAEMGFPMALDHGLPELLKNPGLDEKALLRAFLAIAGNNDDTNILFRSSEEVLNEFRKLSKAALDSDNSDPLAEFCIKHKISPGGSADMLAISIYLYLLINASGNKGLNHFPTMIP